MRTTTGVAALLFALLALALQRGWSEEGKTGKEEAKQEAATPRLGKYLIHSYGATSSPPLYLGYFLLEEGGKYKAFLPGDKPSGEGAYTYDAEKKTVVWKSGPYVEVWGGEFTVEREGKTHKIRLKKSTVATNSAGAKK